MEIFDFLDIIIVVLVIAAGYAAKKFWKYGSPSMAWKTVIVAAIFVGIYTLIAWLSNQLTEAYWSKCFVSYTVATSLYELILKQLKQKLDETKSS